MKKKLLVLLIAVIPTLMPNLVSAIAIDGRTIAIEIFDSGAFTYTPTASERRLLTADCCNSNIDTELGICDCIDGTGD